jgi:hypothetical protein
MHAGIIPMVFDEFGQCAYELGKTASFPLEEAAKHWLVRHQDEVRFALV